MKDTRKRLTLRGSIDVTVNAGFTVNGSPILEYAKNDSNDACPLSDPTPPLKSTGQTAYPSTFHAFFGSVLRLHLLLGC